MSAAQFRSNDYVPTSRLASLLQNASIEATLPAQSELEELRLVLSTTVPIYVSAPPGHSHLRLVQIATQVRRAGFRHIPHIAARNYLDHAMLKDFIERLAGEADVRQVLVIAGDVDQPAGPYAGANAVIESDLLQRYGILHIGISGYPDGHSKLSEGVLHRAFHESLGQQKRAGSLCISCRNSASNLTA